VRCALIGTPDYGVQITLVFPVGLLGYSKIIIILGVKTAK